MGRRLGSISHLELPISRPYREGPRAAQTAQRGHGETDWTTDYAWERWVEDVEGVADTLGLTSFDLVGHSWGGAVATRFAGLHPNRVQHLVLLDPQHVDMVLSPEWDDFGSRIAEINRADGHASREDYVTTVMSLFPRAERSLIEVRSSILILDDSGRFRMPWTTDPSIAGINPSEAEEKKMRRSVTCPTLVAQAEYSEFHIANANERLAAEYLQGEAVIIREAGHNLVYERTEATNELINEFITR